MYLITIAITPEFNAAKALADAFEYGTLTEPTQSWSLIGSAHRISDARVMAQAIADDRQVTVEIRQAFISSGKHFPYAEIKPKSKAKPEPKPEPKPTDEPVIIGGADIEWEPYDGVPADTTDFPTTEDLLRDTF